MPRNKDKTPADLSAETDEALRVERDERDTLVAGDALTDADEPGVLEDEEEAVIAHRTDDDSMREVAAEHNAEAGPEDQVDFQERVKVDVPENPEDHGQSVDQEHLSNKHGYGAREDADHGPLANKLPHEPWYPADRNPAPAREPGPDVRTDEMARDPGQKPDPDARPAEHPGATILSPLEQRELSHLPNEAGYDFEASERERNQPMGTRKTVTDPKKRRFSVHAILVNGVSVELGNDLTASKADGLSEKAFAEGVTRENSDGTRETFPARDVVKVVSVPLAEEVE